MSIYDFLWVIKYHRLENVVTAPVMQSKFVRYLSSGLASGYFLELGTDCCSAHAATRGHVTHHIPGGVTR